MSTVIHNGKSYERLMARVTEEVRILTEDHGLILVVLGLKHTEGSQDIAPCFAPKHRGGLANAMHLFLRLRAYRKGWVGYVLSDSGYIKGLEDLELDGGKITMLDDIIAECEALPA